LSLGDRPNLKFFSVFHPKHRYQIPEHNQYRSKLGSETLHEYGQRSAKQLEEKILELGPENVSAFIGETTMGGLVGDVPPAPNYWAEIRSVCDRYDVHLIIDEVWCGTGTSGKIYSIDHDGISPDFIFLGKTLGAGYGAVSAVVTSETIHNIIKKDGATLPHSITHQGHTLSVAAALAAQKIIHDQKLLDNVTFLSKRIVDRVELMLKGSKFYKNIRGRGLRLSIEYGCEKQHEFGVYVSNRLKKHKNVLWQANDCMGKLAMPFSRNHSIKSFYASKKAMNE
jgi:adenosylmethionine-8-amino-7-oxononanoate aminotransferase